MAANSSARRLLKRALVPLMNERSYRLIQTVAMAWDIRTGKWAEPELQLIPYAVREGEWAIDMGANFGLYSYHLSRAVGRGGKVLAFEPIPFTAATFRLISRVLRFHDNVELIEKGCGDQNGAVTFTVPLQATGALSTGQAHIGGRDDTREGKNLHARYESTKQIACTITRFDDEFRATGELSFIKADVEGAELSAFRGAARTIDLHRPTVLCEINPWFLEGFGVKLSDLLGFFEQRKYKLYFFDDRARRLLPRTAAEIVDDNYVFIHPDRADRFAPLLG